MVVLVNPVNQYWWAACSTARPHMTSATYSFSQYRRTQYKKASTEEISTWPYRVVASTAPISKRFHIVVLVCRINHNWWAACSTARQNPVWKQNRLFIPPTSTVWWLLLLFDRNYRSILSKTCSNYPTLNGSLIEFNALTISTELKKQQTLQAGASDQNQALYNPNYFGSNNCVTHIWPLKNETCMLLHIP